MAYRELVKKNVRLAFRLIGDLATGVMLTKKSKNSFNFSTMNVSVKESAPVTARAVIMPSNKASEEHNAMVKNLLLSYEEVGDINAYDRVTIDGEEWKVGPVISTDSFTVTVEIYKEV